MSGQSGINFGLLCNTLVRLAECAGGTAKRQSIQRLAILFARLLHKCRHTPLMSMLRLHQEHSLQSLWVNPPQRMTLSWGELSLVAAFENHKERG